MNVNQLWPSRTLTPIASNLCAIAGPTSTAHVIVNTEVEAGSRFLVVDGLPHLFTAFGRRLMPIDTRNPNWGAHLLMVYGIIAADRELAPRVTGVVGSYALWNGAKMSPRRWTAYVDGALHLSQYDGTVRRVTGAGVVEGPNNFLVDDGWHVYRGENPPDDFLNRVNKDQSIADVPGLSRLLYDTDRLFNVVIA